MTHLARLLHSTKAQVCFLSETRNSSITTTTIRNRFNYNEAFVVPAQCQPGGLWLLWNDEIDINVVNHSHNFIFALCTNKTCMQQYGLICIYGDPHHRTTREIWERVLNFVLQNRNLPMFCMGDLNELLHVNEKLGPTRADANCIYEFSSCVKQCGLIDLGYNGPAYTGTNKRFSYVPTYERLGRCLGNAEWYLVFPSTIIYYLPMMYNDHAPILAVLNSQRPLLHKPFCFENGWLPEQDFHDIAKQSWQHSSARDFSHKNKFLAADLKKWRRKKRKNNDLLAHLESQILQQQSLHLSLQNHNLQQ
jgi:hypothetical protein